MNYIIIRETGLVRRNWIKINILNSKEPGHMQTYILRELLSRASCYLR